MGVHPSKVKEPKPECRPDYTLPIARTGEQQFACVLRNRSGMGAGEIDFGLRDCTSLCDAEQQDMVDVTFALYEAVCHQLQKRAKRELEYDKALAEHRDA